MVLKIGKFDYDNVSNDLFERLNRLTQSKP